MNGRPAVTVRLVGMLILVISFSPLVADPAIFMPGTERPSILDSLPTDESLLAVALAQDRSAAVAAYRSPGERTRSRILITRGSPDDPIEREINGRIRALLWSLDGSEILAILHRPARRTDGSARLMRIDPATGKSRTLMNLPPTAADLDHWVRPRSLLIAARNQLRVILLDPPRSGPLYRVDGENLAVATLGESEIVVVGQTDAISLLDLGDPPTEEGMPVRARVELEAPAIAVAPGADGSDGLIRLADDTLLEFSVQPFATRPRGQALGLVAARPAQDLEPIQLPPPPARVAAQPAASEPPSPPAEPAPARSDLRPPAETPAPSKKRPEPTPTPSPAASVPDPPSVAPPVKTSAPATPVKPLEPPSRQLAGRLVGPAADRVREVVLLGPDNLLREAARVAPAARGDWGFDGLAAGRYRVQVDGGGGLVLVCRPPFLWIDLGSEPIQAPDIEVLRAF